MAIQAEVRTVEPDLLKVNRWLTRVYKGKKGTRPPRAAMKNVFLLMGADIVALEEQPVLKSLNSGTNKWQALARNRILGPLYKEYQQRVDAWVDGFLAAGGSIPKGKHRKYGPNHLIGWLLVLAFCDDVSAKEILPYIEAAVQNFKDWDEHRLPVEKRIKLPIWHAKDRTPVTVPVLPPKFVAYVIGLLGIWLRRATSEVENDGTE